MPLARCSRDDRFPGAVELLCVQFLKGVAFLHESGIAHLNLKPGNVLVDHKHELLSPQLSIIDFGLSIFVESEETMGLLWDSGLGRTGSRNRTWTCDEI
jgi:serine/threonine protein kinase